MRDARLAAAVATAVAATESDIIIVVVEQVSASITSVLCKPTQGWRAPFKQSHSNHPPASRMGSLRHQALNCWFERVGCPVVQWSTKYLPGRTLGTLAGREHATSSHFGVLGELT